VNVSLTQSDLNYISSSSKGDLVSGFAAKLFCETSQLESSVNNYTSAPVPNFKNPTNGVWAIFKTTEQLFESTYSQYTRISRNFLIQHRKTDLIFPFHYFW
jgi:hypothetical protein